VGGQVARDRLWSGELCSILCLCSPCGLVLTNEPNLTPKPTEHSSVGRAVDCSSSNSLRKSIGRWFDSGCSDHIVMFPFCCTNRCGISISCCCWRGHAKLTNAKRRAICPVCTPRTVTQTTATNHSLITLLRTTRPTTTQLGTWYPDILLACIINAPASISVQAQTCGAHACAAARVQCSLHRRSLLLAFSF
jgi:hypothetical protein